MTASHDTEEVSQKLVCCACVGEAFLSDLIERTGAHGTCAYCDDKDQCWSVGRLADAIETAFEDHYTRTADGPNSWQQTLLSDRESTYDWERDGEPVVDAIANAADIKQEIAEDVQFILAESHSDFDAAKMSEETEFDNDTYYAEKGHDTGEWESAWRRFETSLKTEARFFSRSAAEHLQSVFARIDSLKTRDGLPLVVDAGPGQPLDHLYRARVFQSDALLEEALCRPDIHLGSPPARLARAGRMNANGISVFYGATAQDAALAEVRPPVGSKVAVARFTITRRLRLLDLTAAEDVHETGSIFDATFKARLERAAFLRQLSQRMTRPVMPDDEAFEYLTTQAAADYLATENEPVLDGIIFRSVQASEGLNVVLFQKAARVARMNLPKGTKIDARSGSHTEDGWEVDYVVTERVTPEPKPKPKPKPKPTDRFSPMQDLQTFIDSMPDDDFREPTLQVDPDTVSVHDIERVQVHHTPHTVSRYRYAENELKF